MADRLLTCVSDALSDDLRPVCKVYQTHGTPVIFQCCECDDEGANGEVSIHFRRLFDADSSTFDEVQRVRPCRGGLTAAQFRIVLARCRPIINEHGEIPESGVLTEHTQDQLRDIELLWQSLACCSGLNIRVDDVSADLSEPGTCSVVYADLTVAVSVPALVPPPVPSVEPTFTSITPDHGQQQDDLTVTIVGTNLMQVNRVEFQGRPISVFNSQSDTELSFDSFIQSDPGTTSELVLWVNFVPGVKNGPGPTGDRYAFADVWTTDEPASTVTSVTPDNGSTENVEITVVGTGLTWINTVLIDGHYYPFVALSNFTGTATLELIQVNEGVHDLIFLTESPPAGTVMVTVEDAFTVNAP